MDESEKKKVQLVFEFDRCEFEALCFLTDRKLPEEMWQKMIEKPISGNCEVLDCDAKSAKLLLASIAMLSVMED